MTFPVVDPSPTAPPIQVDVKTLDELLAAFPAAASDADTLALTPHNFEEATAGPTPQISPTAYVEMTKPNGMTFLSPLANVEHYVAKGCTAGAEIDIPDLVAYWAEKAAQQPAPPPEPAP